MQAAAADFWQTVQARIPCAPRGRGEQGGIMTSKLFWAIAGAVALILPVAAATGAAAADRPVPEECRLPRLSPAEKARCDFIARTPDLCERAGLSGETQRFCDRLRDAQACSLSERSCAAAGFVLIARGADRLALWRATDFRPLRLRWFRPWLLERLGPEQTVTLLVGPEDLYSWWIEELAHLIYERGGAVIVTDATLDDADRLRELLGVSGAAWGEDEGTSRLYGLRDVIDDDGRRHSLSFVLFSDPERGGLQFHLPLDPRETEWLLARIGPNPPALDDSSPMSAAGSALLASAENNLYDLAKATTTSTKKSLGGQSLELDNIVIAARALDPTNWTDVYAVKQQAVGFPCAGQTEMSFGAASSINPANAKIVVQQQKPGDVASGASYQTGVDFPFAGAVGYPTTSTAFDVAPANAEIDFSVTTDLPPGASIELESSPLDWQLTVTDPPSTGTTLSTSWLWLAPATAYEAQGAPLMFDTASVANGTTCSNRPLGASLVTTLDRPFPTPSAEVPVVTSVAPSNVVVGEEFVITGTGFYPSIVTAVKVAGADVPAADWVVNSDTQVTVTAPAQTSAELYGTPLAVEIDTTSGSSNSTVNVTITEG